MSRETHAKPVGVAMIGAGVIGRLHVEALSDMGDLAALRAIASRNADRAKPFADLYAGTPPIVMTDISALYDHPDIKMAIVKPPPSFRRTVIALLAATGLHILLEKLIARALCEAKEVADLCNAAKVTLGIVFRHRHQASEIEVAHVVATGELGRLGVVEISVPLWRDQSSYNDLGRGT